MKIKRWMIQLLVTITSNSHIQGFLKATIYQGKTKNVCVPGLNCYSCPGALGACPIGSLQGVLNNEKQSFSLYVLGMLTAFGVLFGRMICGFLCPFGFMQDLLHKIPSKKIKTNERLHNIFKYLKYVILAVFVILLPMFWVDKYGIRSPYFCKYICPAGTLEGGIPLLIGNEGLRALAGSLFLWKLFVLISILVLSVFIYRVFCKYLCPLGAFYSLFNRFSFYNIQIDSKKCTRCGACSRVCKMHVDAMNTPNDAECIRCGDCVNICPQDAMKMGFQKNEINNYNKVIDNK